MHHRLLNSMAAIVALSAAIALTPALASAQRGGRGAPAPPPEPGPFDRMPDGTPDMNGIWRVRGGLGNITPNIVEVGGVAVEGDDRAIPYTPVYAQLRAESDQRMFEEPELHCYMSGVPSHMWRQSYLGAGLVIQHTSGYVVFLHEFPGVPPNRPPGWTRPYFRRHQALHGRRSRPLGGRYAGHRDHEQQRHHMARQQRRPAFPTRSW